jgi:hypothetical protein
VDLSSSKPILHISGARSAFGLRAFQVTVYTLRSRSTINWPFNSRNYSIQGSGSVPLLSFGSRFFLWIFRDKILTNLNMILQFNLRFGATLHIECDFAMVLTYVFLQGRVSTSRQDEYYWRLLERNSGTLGNYSWKLQDYSETSWSTFQPRGGSSTIREFSL